MRKTGKTSRSHWMDARQTQVSNIPTSNQIFFFLEQRKQHLSPGYDTICWASVISPEKLSPERNAAFIPFSLVPFGRLSDNNYEKLTKHIHLRQHFCGNRKNGYYHNITLRLSSSVVAKNDSSGKFSYGFYLSGQEMHRFVHLCYLYASPAACH